MGLDTTHGAWNGPYSQFMRWRIWLAKQVGIPLNLMDGFYGWEWDADEGDKLFSKHWKSLWDMSGNDCYFKTLQGMQEFGKGISWESIGDPLKELLHHSDCEGKIQWWKCKIIALRLLQVYRQTAGVDVAGHGGPEHKRGCYDSMRAATLRFALGCLRAWKAREHLEFH